MGASCFVLGGPRLSGGAWCFLGGSWWPGCGSMHARGRPSARCGSMHDGRSLAAGRAWIVCTDVCGRPDRSWLIFSRASRKGRASSSSFARCARAVGLMDERRAAFGRPDRVLSCGLWLAACKQRTKRKESADNQQWARGESHRQVHLLHTRKSKGCGCEDTRDGCCVR